MHMPDRMTGTYDRAEVITSVQRRRRWTPEEKIGIVEETYLPGNSVSLVDRVPRRGVAGRWSPRSPAWNRADQAAASGQPDDGIIAQGGDGFQRHVSGALDSPFIVLLQKDCANEPDDRSLVGKDADDFGAPLDLAVEALDRIRGMQLRPVLRRESSCRRGRRVRLRPSARRAWAAWGATGRRPCATARSRGRGVVLGEGGGDEGGNDASAALAGMGERVAEEVNPAALPARVHHLGDCRLDAFVGVGDDELDAAKAAPPELAQEHQSRRSRPRRGRCPCQAPRAARRC